jgi:hypothetical protein
MSSAPENTESQNPANIQTADFNRHGKLKLKPHPGFVHAKDRNLVALNVSELGRACGNFPIVLARNPNDGRLVLMAMLGIRSGENSYFGEQFWESTYVPLAVQRHPFIVGLDDRVTGAPKLATCLEIDSACLSESDGLPLFNSDGTEGDVLRNANQLLRNMFEAGQFTENFVAKLEELELVVPFDIDLQLPRGAVNRITGLYTLDENRLKALSAEQLKDLQNRDYLAPCHLMLVSLYQLNQLIRLRNRKGGEQVTNFRLDFKTDAPAAANA